MANINQILARAAALRNETALNSISPERAGGIMYDTLIALNELWLSQGAALVISKIYASVAAMNADTSPVSDLTGQPLVPGQIVVIASSDSDNGSVYRYNGTSTPRWTMIGNIGGVAVVDNLTSDSSTLALAARQGKVLDGKISQLGQEVFALETPSITVVQGTLVTTNGNTYSSSKLVRTAGYLIAEAIRITTSGNKAKVFGYTDNNSYVGCTDFYTENTEARIPHATKYKIIFGKSDDSSITPEDFNTLGINISLILDTSVVRTDSQFFTDDEKEVVRNNINAASKNDTLLIKQEASQVAANYTGWDAGYVDSNGRIIKTSGSIKVSGKIFIIPDTPIIVNILLCSSSYSTLAAFDENDNYIAECSICQSTNISTQTTIQTAGKNVSYIRITAIAGVAPSVTATIPVIDKPVAQAVTELINKKYVLAEEQTLNSSEKEQARENIGAASEEDITFITTGEVNPATSAEIATWDYGYVKPNGTIQTTSSGSYKYSPKIYIVPNSTIRITGMYCNTAVTSLAAYDAEDHLISACSISQSTSISSANPVTIDTNGYNVAYIRITYGGGYASYGVYVTQITGTESVKERIIEIEQTIDNIGIGVQWDGKSWVALGTSITDTNNTLAPDGTATGKYVPFLVALSGMVVTNKGVAGAVIGGHILYYAGHTPAMSNAAIVTVEGGVNDWAGSKPLGQVGDTVPYLVQWTSPVWDNGGDANGTFAGACYQVLKTVQENAPNAVLVVFTDNTGKSVPSTGANCSREAVNSLGLRQKDYTDMLIAVAEYMGITVINAGQLSMINQDNPEYLIDQIHQTELGGKQYATVIWSYLKNVPNRVLTV